MARKGPSSRLTLDRREEIEAEKLQNDLTHKQRYRLAYASRFSYIGCISSERRFTHLRQMRSLFLCRLYFSSIVDSRRWRIFFGSRVFPRWTISYKHYSNRYEDTVEWVGKRYYTGNESAFYMSCKCWKKSDGRSVFQSNDTYARCYKWRVRS